MQGGSHPYREMDSNFRFRVRNLGMGRDPLLDVKRDQSGVSPSAKGPYNASASRGSSYPGRTSATSESLRLNAIEIESTLVEQRGRLAIRQRSCKSAAGLRPLSAVTTL